MFGKWDEISYVQIFMLLHHKDSVQKGFKLMVQRRGKISLPSQTVNWERRKMRR